MKDWICFFEKYRIDCQLLDVNRRELALLPEDSPRREKLSREIERLEQLTRSAEWMLSRYDEQVSSPRDALRRADERLFLAYRYIKGLTMEQTASEMCISRDTVYRIRRRILSRGSVPKADFTISEADSGDARSRVLDKDQVRSACFAGSAPQKPSAAELSAAKVRERGYPDFCFTGK